MENGNPIYAAERTMQMAREVTKLCNGLRRYETADFNSRIKKELNENSPDGIYFFFEEGEKAGEFDRIVRVGTHKNSKERLVGRLSWHCGKQTSDFNREVGFSILRKNDERNEKFEKFWKQQKPEFENDKQKNAFKVWCAEIKEKIDERMARTSFAVLPMPVETNAEEAAMKEAMKERLWLESHLIAILSWGAFWSEEFRPSKDWIGNFSPKYGIRTYGLWLMDGLLSELPTEQEMEKICAYFEEVKN